MSRPQRIITDKEIKNICKEYLAGKSLNNLSKQNKLQKHQVKQILLDNNIKVLSAYESKVLSCSLEEKEYFSNLGKLECYVLGLIFGDGCVHYNEEKYKYALTITSNDLDILESARLLFGSQFVIKKRKRSNAYNFVVNSKFLCQELISKFQLQSPKSNSLIWPNLPEQMYSYFISGLLSTDGCIEIRKKHLGFPCAIQFSYSSNCLEFVEQLQKYLIQKLNLPQTKIKINKAQRKNMNYSVRYSGAAANTILNFIYDGKDKYTKCQRKFDIYQKYLTSLKSQTQQCILSNVVDFYQQDSK